MGFVPNQHLEEFGQLLICNDVSGVESHVWEFDVLNTLCGQVDVRPAVGCQALVAWNSHFHLFGITYVSLILDVC